MDWLIDWIDWLIDLIDWLIYWFIDWFISWFIDWFINWFIDGLWAGAPFDKWMNKWPFVQQGKAVQQEMDSVQIPAVKQVQEEDVQNYS